MITAGLDLVLMELEKVCVCVCLWLCVCVSVCAWEGVHILAVSKQQPVLRRTLNQKKNEGEIQPINEATQCCTRKISTRIIRFIF